MMRAVALCLAISAIAPTHITTSIGEIGKTLNT